MEKMKNFEKRNRHKIFLFLWVLMFAGLIFGTPPDFINDKISMGSTRVGESISENSYNYDNLFMGLLNNIGKAFTLLFLLGIVLLGYEISLSFKQRI